MSDAEANPQTVKVRLSTPIARKGGDVTEVTLRKPKAGAMRGLKIEDLYSTDVNSLLVLLPRITEPQAPQAHLCQRGGCKRRCRGRNQAPETRRCHPLGQPRLGQSPALPRHEDHRQRLQIHDRRHALADQQRRALNGQQRVEDPDRDGSGGLSQLVFRCGAVQSNQSYLMQMQPCGLARKKKLSPLGCGRGDSNARQRLLGVLAGQFRVASFTTGSF